MVGDQSAILRESEQRLMWILLIRKTHYSHLELMDTQEDMFKGRITFPKEQHQLISDLCQLLLSGTLLGKHQNKPKMPLG